MITRAQLEQAGLGPNAIRARVRKGFLHRRHRGVYSVGPGIDVPLAAETAALLACGAGAALSHRSAAAFWRLLRAPSLVEVSVPRARRATHEGVVVHRVASLEEVWVREGLRVTTPRRTLVDLAAVAGPEELERAVNEAHALRLVRPGDVAAPAGARGASALRRATVDDGGFTRSEAERRLKRLCRRAGLPLPETNVRVAGLEVDALWRAERLVVEFDGYAAHGHRAAFERDRRRDQRLRAAGLDVVRITWRQLTEEPETVVVLLARLLTMPHVGPFD